MQFIAGIMMGIVMTVGTFVIVCESTGIRFQPVYVAHYQGVR